jgi:hypothetical protein
MVGVVDPGVRRIDPPRAVEVLHDDGAWYRGFQDGWSFWNGAWRASVSYVVQHDWGAGKYVRSIPEGRVRLPG